MVIALAPMTGEKRFLGFVETDTENAQVLTPFLRSLLERGLDISQGVLVILDGGKLRAAVRIVAAPWSNGVSGTSRGQLSGSDAVAAAPPAPPYDEAVVRSGSHGELEDRNQSRPAVCCFDRP